jgi:hypothetical protein
LFVVVAWLAPHVDAVIDKAGARDSTATNTLSKSGGAWCGALFQRLEKGIQGALQRLLELGRRVVDSRHGAAS